MSTLALSEAPLIRRARLAESLVIAWMMVELVVALWAGIAARSVALTAFGVDSGIEVFTAVVVLRQLLLHTDRATKEELDARERQASRLVGWALYGLIVYIIISSAGSLITRTEPESSLPGMLLAIAALLVMTPLWRWRRRLAAALDSPALRGAREPCAARGRRLRTGLHLHGGDAARRPAAQQPVRLVVGRFIGRSRDDLVDPRRGE